MKHAIGGIIIIAMLLLGGHTYSDDECTIERLVPEGSTIYVLPKTCSKSLESLGTFLTCPVHKNDIPYWKEKYINERRRVYKLMSQVRSQQRQITELKEQIEEQEK